MPRGTFLLLFVFAGCSLSVTESDYVGGARPDGGPGVDGGSNDGAANDAGTDAGDQCRDDEPFGALQDVAGLEDVLTYSTPHLSDNELELYFDSDGNLIRATRDSKTGKFTTRTAVSTAKPAASSSADANPMLSLNGLDLFFTSNLNDGNGFHLHRSRRTTRTEDFPKATAIPLEGANQTVEPFVSFDGTELFYAVTSPVGGTSHIYRIAMSDQTPTGNAGVILDTLAASTESNESDPTLSPDGRTLYFARTYQQANRLWRAKRKDTTTFETPELALDIPSAPVRPGWISPDNCRLYLLLDRKPMFAERTR